jgi:hypothetical protein
MLFHFRHSLIETHFFENITLFIALRSSCGVRGVRPMNIGVVLLSFIIFMCPFIMYVPTQL